MNVGKDPFPRDEVTGLAAFDHLEPVGSLSVVPDESGETPVLTEAGDEVADDLQLAAASANQQTAAVEHKRPQHSSYALQRGDATLPLDLTAMMPQIEHGFAATSPEATVSSAELGSNSMSWDDDEATRVHSQSGSPAQLDMEWDDDEPPTEMRPFAMFDAPPLAERHDWPEWNSVDEDDTTHYLPKATSSIRSATPTIRATTPPVNAVMPPRQNSQPLVTGGRPSPFPAPIAAPADARRGAAPPEARDTATPAASAAAPANFTGRPLPAGKTAQGLPPAAALPEAGARVAPVAAGARPSQRASTPATFLDALKAKHRPSLVLAGGTAVGLLALYLIVHAIASVPRVGNAVLEVSPADAKVQVDGKDVQGSGSPYTVSELSVGSHELAVTKTGYGEYRGSFAVKSGESTTVPVIELAPEAREIGFSVRSSPDGAAVWVDGEPTDNVTPVRMTGIKPGQHSLQLKLAGYADYEVQLYLPEQTVLQLQTAKLIALPSEQPEEPFVRSRRGRSRAVDALDSEGTSLASARAARRARRASAAAEEATAASVAPRRRRDVSAKSDSDVEAPKAAASSSGKTGTLRLNTRPWSQVVVDGRPVGNTPQPNLELSAGKHKLLLSNPSLGLSKNVTVTIKPGETNTLVINLAE